MWMGRAFIWITPGKYFAPGLKFLALTFCPTNKSLVCALLLWGCFWAACLLQTVGSSCGLIKWSLVMRSRPMNNLHGGTPVVVCGVTLYINKKFSNLLSNGSPSLSPAQIVCLKVPMNLSTCPLDEGWFVYYYGVHLISCLTPFCFIKW